MNRTLPMIALVVFSLGLSACNPFASGTNSIGIEISNCSPTGGAGVGNPGGAGVGNPLGGAGVGNPLGGGEVGSPQNNPVGSSCATISYQFPKQDVRGLFHPSVQIQIDGNRVDGTPFSGFKSYENSTIQSFMMTQTVDCGHIDYETLSSSRIRFERNVESIKNCVRNFFPDKDIENLECRIFRGNQTARLGMSVRCEVTPVSSAGYSDIPLSHVEHVKIRLIPTESLGSGKYALTQIYFDQSPSQMGDAINPHLLPFESQTGIADMSYE